MMNYVRLLAWRNKFEKGKAYKRELRKELMPAAWHPTRWSDWGLPEDDKKGIKPIFIDENYYKVGK